jgi:hypothetical protein
MMAARRGGEQRGDDDAASGGGGMMDDWRVRRCVLVWSATQSASMHDESASAGVSDARRDRYGGCQMPDGTASAGARCLTGPLRWVSDDPLPALAAHRVLGNFGSLLSASERHRSSKKN